MLLDIISNAIINFAISLWHITQMVFVYSLAIVLVVSVIVLICCAIYAQDKANKKY